jgi:NhaP-type Na+/H+ or K+/H+ antiporter
MPSPSAALMNATNSSSADDGQMTFDELAAEFQALIESVRSEKCDAMHSMTCVEITQTCLRWDPEGGADGGGNCSMLPSLQRPAPKTIQCYYGDSDDGLGGMPALLLALGIGSAVATLLVKLSSQQICGRRMGLPFTVVMFLFGFTIETITTTQFVKQNFSRMDLSVSGWVNSHPHIILFVLLPPLLFEDSASIDYHVFRKSLPSSLLLAGPGVMISSALSGAFSWFLFNVLAGNEYGWTTHMLLGGILSATDPVAVLGVLKSLGAPAKLNLIIGGESLLNDGTAVVVFWIFRDLVAECSDTDFGTVLSRFLVLAIGGVSWGWIAAHVMYLWIRAVTEPIVEVTIVITCVFAVFWTSEEILGVSGILASVVFGLGTARKSYFCMSPECLERNHMMWEQMGFVSTLIIFTLTGIVARGKVDDMFNREVDDSDILSGESLSRQELTQLLVLTVIFYVAVFVVRGLTITMLFPILQTIGYGVTKKEAMFMTFGGLRGAVSLALALLIDAHPTIESKTKDFVLIQTAGVVTLSLFINGTLSGYVYQRLDLYRKNRYRDLLARQAMACLHDGAISWMRANLSGDEFHGHADFKVVEDLMIDFSNAELVHDELVGYIAKPVNDAPWKAEIIYETPTTKSSPRGPIKVPTRLASTKVLLGDASVELGSSDPYVEVVLDRAGRPSKRKSTSVQKGTLNPVWKTSNKFRYRIESAETTMYATVYDWDYGLVDDYLGEARVDLRQTIASTSYPDTAEFEQDFELTAPTRNFSVEEGIVQSFESPLSSPQQGVVDEVEQGITDIIKAGEATARNIEMAASSIVMSARKSALIKGSLRLRVKYVPKNPEEPMTPKKAEFGKRVASIGHVEIEVLKASGLAASDPPNVSSTNKKLLNQSMDATDMLADANRMVRMDTDQGELSEFDARNALYGLFFQHMLATFREAAEADTIGDTAANCLEHALGVANDAAVEAHDSGTLKRGALLVMWDEVKDFIRTGNDGILGARVPHLAFAHMQACTEILFVLTKGIDAMSSRSTFGTLTGEEAAADDEVLQELDAVKKAAREMIHEQRRCMPNTYTAIHSVIAFRVLAEEYRHRLKRGYEMGSVSLKMLRATEDCLEERFVRQSLAPHC